MSQDIVSDGLNQIMNAKRSSKRALTIRRTSKLLINLLEIMKKKEHISYKLNEDKSVDIEIIKLNECRATKPRHPTSYKTIDKYLRRFLPSRNFGTLVITTSNGLMTHQDLMAAKLGGSLIAYFY